MLDRLLDDLRALVLDELRTTFLGVYGYIVQRATETTVDASPASSLTLPTITGAPLVSSLLGQLVTPAQAGAPCRIRFVNGDQTRPVCVGIDGVPVDATIDAIGTLGVGPSAQVQLAGGNAPIAREGDAASIIFPQGTLFGVLTPPGGAPATYGTIVIVGPVSGIISSGGRARA